MSRGKQTTSLARAVTCTAQSILIVDCIYFKLIVINVQRSRKGIYFILFPLMSLCDSLEFYAGFYHLFHERSKRLLVLIRSSHVNEAFSPEKCYISPIPLPTKLFRFIVKKVMGTSSGMEN